MKMSNPQGIKRPERKSKIASDITLNEKNEEGQKGSEKHSAKKHETDTSAGESIDHESAGQNLVSQKVEKYRGRRADLKPFAASVFSPYLFRGEHRHLIGCGAAALALITGVPPEQIAARHRGRHYADRFMIRFLNQRKFRLLRLTPLLISTAQNKLGYEHVILISQLLRDYEATWGIIFDDLY